ncbi:MAG: hypothetical protein QXE78_02440 [Nitrososphaeria archaeon]
MTDNEVKTLISIGGVIEAVENALPRRAWEEFRYLLRSITTCDLRIMPSYLEEYDVSAVKNVNSHPKNRIKYNLPIVMAVIVLEESKDSCR